MREFIVAVLLATVLYVVGAEVSYIEPKNYFSNDKHCVDLECAKSEWKKIFEKMTNLDEMKACAETANDDQLKESVANLITVIEDNNNYYKQTKDQTGCKQNTYRTMYMFSNIVWYRAKIIEECVEKNTQQNVQACFKQPLDEVFKRSDNIISCWKKAGDKKCEEKKEGGNGGGGGGGNSGGDSKDDDKSSGSKEDDEDNKVCDEQKDVSNANMTCIQSYWKSIKFGETPPVMEKCLGQIGGNTNKLKKNIDECAAGIERMKKCYEYSENKNYEEMNTRLDKVQKLEEDIKKEVSKLPEPNQACFQPAFEKTDSYNQGNKVCMNQ